MFHDAGIKDAVFSTVINRKRKRRETGRLRRSVPGPDETITIITEREKGVTQATLD